MGLLDELAGKTFDEATAATRGRRARREAARDLLVAELRDYSEKIERMRIALIDLIEFLTRTDVAADVEDSARAALEAVARAARPSAEVDQACNDLVADVPLNHAEWSAVSVFLQDEIQQRLLGSSYAKTVMLAERSQQERRELDLAWARVRPLLDDLVEVRVVIALRAHRHDLRARLDYAMAQMARLHRVPLADREYRTQRGALASDLADVVRFADGWSMLIGRVRGETGRLRRL